MGRRSQFAVIPLGIDLSVFTDVEMNRGELRNELDASENDFIVGIVGRICPVKDHVLFIRAAAAFQARYADRVGAKVRFVVIGDGPDRSSLQELARQYQVADDVIFLGNRTDPEVFYAGVDVLMLTSRNEGTPLSIIEAMACGRPVVSTLVGGVANALGAPVESAASGYVVHERGIGVRDREPDSLAAALFRLLDDDTLRQQLAAKGPSYVNRCHDQRRLVAEIASLYRGLLGLDGDEESPVADQETQEIAVESSAAGR